MLKCLNGVCTTSSLSWINFLNLDKRKIECLSSLISIKYPWKYIQHKQTFFPLLSSIIAESDLAFKAEWPSGYKHQTSIIPAHTHLTKHMAEFCSIKLNLCLSAPLNNRDSCPKPDVVKCFAFVSLYLQIIIELNWILSVIV